MDDDSEENEQEHYSNNREHEDGSFTQLRIDWSFFLHLRVSDLKSAEPERWLQFLDDWGEHFEGFSGALVWYAKSKEDEVEVKDQTLRFEADKQI